MKKVYLETFGCQMNVSDSERVSTVLEAEGFEMTAEEAEADVILFNTCSVREKAEQKLFTRVGQIRHQENTRKKMVGVLGCVAQLEGETLFDKSNRIDFVVGTKAVGRIPETIRQAAQSPKRLIDLGERDEDYDWTVSPNQRSSPFVSFVPIIEGCNKFCTYCIVPFSRGREKSLSATEIVRQVENLKTQGVKEIHLIGQNVNSYRPKSLDGLEKFSGATLFSKLLRAVAMTGIERIKFTTSFPRDFHPDIVDAIDEYPNLCNWVHLPVQSGSDRILKAMRRGHTIDNYLRRVDHIRQSPRNISLTTDIIVGFPGETEEDFLQTVELVKYCKFDSAYIFKYSPRPGTPAFEMPETVSAKEKTRRFLELEEAQKLNQNNSLQNQLNKVHEVLAEDLSTRSAEILVGHTTCHRVVNFPAQKNILGQIVNVRVTECKTNTLFGKIV